MQYKIGVLALLAGAGYGYSQATCTEELNLQPMYGKVRKCPEQSQADREFIDACDERYNNRKVAAEHIVADGWNAFGANQLDLAMKRFNQAWLLDSINAEVYRGFASVLGRKGRYQASVPLFEKSLILNPAQARGWQGLATSYGQMFFQTKDVSLLHKCIAASKTCIAKDPRNAQAYGQLAAAYSYFIQKDSARKYLAIADRMDSRVVNSELRQQLQKPQ